MLGLIEKCFPDRIEAWKPELKRMIPSYGTQLSDDAAVAAATIARTAKVLAINP
jgi:malate dehydrogenase (quinone)